MKKFLFQSLLFLGLLFILDALISTILQQFRPIDYKLFIDSKKDFFNSATQADILLIGDSHIADAVDPRIVEKYTGLKTYNLGIYHATPLETYFTLRAAFDHLETKPKLIVIGANPDMFVKPMTSGKYTPLIINDPILRWNLHFESTNPFELENFFSTVKESYLFSSLVNSLTGKKYKPTREIKAVYNGYLESRNQIAGTEWSNFKSEPYKAVYSEQVEYFKKTIELASSHHVRVLLINTPIWFEKIDADKANDSTFEDFQSILKKTSIENELPFLNPDFDLMQDQLSQPDFLNTDHLNYFGAQKFSKDLSLWIKINEKE
jgi:hypothetical protein